jgi:RNA polymerase sporulation-specific sigma factor
MIKNVIAKIKINLIILSMKLGIYKPKQIYYIGSTDLLPPPLSQEEEGALISKLKIEREQYATRTVLIERNLRLVVYIARRFENTGMIVEDLISIGTLGLIKAINTFNPDKNIKLATYASKCIENEILMQLRKNVHAKSEVSIDEPLNIDWDGNELLLSDVLGTDNDIIYRDLEEEVDKELLNKALTKLGSKERCIIEMRFGLNNSDEMTQKEVADKLGISQSYISRLEKKIIVRLKKEMNKMM